jgi:hypothetical protein
LSTSDEALALTARRSNAIVIVAAVGTMTTTLAVVAAATMTLASSYAVWVQFLN